MHSDIRRFPRFLEMDTRQKTVIYAHITNLIIISVGKAAVSFKPDMKARSRLAASPRRQNPIDGL